MRFPIAVTLLEAERERLARDHYDTFPYQPDDTRPDVQSCVDCGRAYDVKIELAALRAEKEAAR